MRVDARAHEGDLGRGSRSRAALRFPRARRSPRFSGLEPFEIGEDTGFVLIGERTNVTGSARFRRLIEADDFNAAVDVALEQVRGGANLIDVNMDADLLEGEQAMRTFLNVIATEPEVARLPVMIDSSKWTVLEAGLQCLQGKGIVNSISLKEGEEEFLHHARRIRDYGAGVVVMAFDEEGQATEVERRVAICGRAYDLLVDEVGFRPEDIVFDPNVLAVATGIEEHDDYARAFLECLPRIKERCPGVRTSGGISNLSFSFRGNDVVREAMHAAFLYHAIGPASTWASSMPGSSRSTRTSSRSSRNASRTCSSTAGRTRRNGSSRSPIGSAARERNGSSTCAGARARWASGSSMRSCTGSSTSSRTTPRRRARPPSGRWT